MPVARVDRPAHRHLEHVVVAVGHGEVAEDARVLLRAPLAAASTDAPAENVNFRVA